MDDRDSCYIPTCGCGRRMEMADEIAFWEQTGYCLNCDHIRGEYLSELRNEL